MGAGSAAASAGEAHTFGAELARADDVAFRYPGAQVWALDGVERVGASG